MKPNPQGAVRKLVLKSLERIPCSNGRGPDAGVSLKADHGKGKVLLGRWKEETAENLDFLKRQLFQIFVFKASKGPSRGNIERRQRQIIIGKPAMGPMYERSDPHGVA